MLTTEGEFLKISAFREEDLLRLKERIEVRMTGGSRSFRIPADKGDMISLVYRIGEVLENEVDGSDMLFKVRVNHKAFDKIGYMLAAYDAVRPAEGEQGRDV